MPAQNDSAEDLLRKHLPSAFKGPAWDALLAAVAVGDQLNFDNARAAFSQLFRSTALGIYLDRKAADVGVARPPGIGMDDELFRKLCIKASTSGLTSHSLLSLLEIFYGEEAVRAYCDTEVAESYALVDGYDLTVLFDEKTEVTVLFATSDFAQISAAKAQEVALALTKAFRKAGTKAYAVARLDPETATTKVRIYSPSLGMGSAVRVTGGRAQNILKFPTSLPLARGNSPSTVTWTVTKPEVGVVRFTLTGATSVDLTQVETGDYVNIYGSAFSSGNRGSFPLTDVYVAYPGGTLTQYFEVENESGVAETVAELAVTDVQFFRPTRHTPQASDGRTVVVSAASRTELDVRLPATSQAVLREEGTGAYFQAVTEKTVSSVQRRKDGSLHIASTAHGFAVGTHFFLSGTRPSTSAPALSAGGAGLVQGALSSSVSEVNSPLPGTYWHTATKLANGKVLYVGGTTDSFPTPQTGCSLYQHTGSSTVNGVTEYSYTWTGVAPLVGARCLHATQLLDVHNQPHRNKVWVTGGYNAGFLDTTELYNPDANSWAAGPTLAAARLGHVLVITTDGIQMVISGATANDTTTTDVEHFDLDLTATGNSTLVKSRIDHRALALSGGQVLVTGGRNLPGAGNAFDPTTGTFLAHAELYTGSWALVGRMSYSRVGHQMVLLDNGKVLVVGGMGKPDDQPGSLEALRTCEIYDPTTKSFQATGRLNFARWGHTAVKLSDGRVLVQGGASDTSWTTFVTRAEYYDPKTGKWTVAPSLMNQPNGRWGGEACLLPDGTVVSLGGKGTGGLALGTADVYNPASDVYSDGGLDGLYKVSAVPDANNLVAQNSRTSYTSSPASATLLKVTAGTGTHKGPFVFDPTEGAAFTAIETTTTQVVNAGERLRTLAVTNASSFPDEEGYLALSFGTSLAVYPVKYLGRVSSTSLLLDTRHEFTGKLPVGTKVTLLAQKGPWVPQEPESAGCLYLTASPAGRISAQSHLKELAAGDVDLQVTVVYPGDKGLGGAGKPTSGAQKLSDAVEVWGGDDLAAELASAREG